MKTFIGAIALVIAAPVAAQTAPAADPHAGHAQGMDHSQHKHDCKECCEKMKGKDGKMECMDNKVEAKPGAPDSSGERGHESHAH